MRIWLEAFATLFSSARHQARGRRLVCFWPSLAGAVILFQMAGHVVVESGSLPDADVDARAMADLAGLLALLWTLLGFEWIATGLVGDKESRRFEHVYLTAWTDAELFAHYAAGPFLAIGLALLSLLPVFAVWAPVSTVTPGQAGAVLAFLGSAMLAATSVGLLAGVLTCRRADAVAVAVALILLLAFVGPWLIDRTLAGCGFDLPYGVRIGLRNPLLLALPASRAFGADLDVAVAVIVAWFLATALACAALARLLIRRAWRWQTEPWVWRTLGRRRRAPVGDRPIRWRERHRPAAHWIEWLARALLQAAFAGWFAWTAHLASGAMVHRLLGERGAADVARFRLVNALASVGGGLELAVVLAVALLAAQSFALDKERGAFADFALTRLTAAEILADKLRGTVALLRLPILSLLGSWLLGILAGALPWWAFAGCVLHFVSLALLGLRTGGVAGLDSPQAGPALHEALLGLMSPLMFMIFGMAAVGVLVDPLWMPVPFSPLFALALAKTRNDPTATLVAVGMSLLLLVFLALPHRGRWPGAWFRVVDAYETLVNLDRPAGESSLLATRGPTTGSVHE